MSLLRESFAAINARFHLAGFCALADLLLVITADAAGDDPAYIVPVCMMVTIRFLTLYGILGLVFQAASGRTGGISFARYASALARPLLWLQLKALMIALPIASLLAGLGLFGYLLATGSPATPDEHRAALELWGGTLFDLAFSLLLLYSTPLCIRSRERGERGPHVRQGWQILWASGSESLPLVGLLATVAAIHAGLLYLRGPEAQDAPPDIPMALGLLVCSYLELVALYGAARVVLRRLEPGLSADPGLTERGASSAPGPPA
ncbi:MAG: hypothetical protein DMF50_07180 [Acidobacteria bacterium]|nr:MAG: hypothetical protein DMF50_07180 [Acidobacteriota bacterium]